MVTKRYLEEKWLKPQRERLRKEALQEGLQEGIKKGLERGRAEERKAWTTWNRRREEAAAQGLSFDEPPPGS